MAKRTDSNQAEIVAALRQLPGVTVQDIHEVGRGCPDILVGYHGWLYGRAFPANYLIEIKTITGLLNSREALWHDTWRGQVAIAHTIDEALAIIGYGIHTTRPPSGPGYTITDNESRPPSARAGDW